MPPEELPTPPDTIERMKTILLDIADTHDIQERGPLEIAWQLLGGEGPLGGANALATLEERRERQENEHKGEVRREGGSEEWSSF